MGFNKFIRLRDTPDSYSGQAGKFTKVKITEDGLEFTTAPTLTFVETEPISMIQMQAGVWEDHNLSTWIPVGGKYVEIVIFLPYNANPIYSAGARKNGSDVYRRIHNETGAYLSFDMTVELDANRIIETYHSLADGTTRFWAVGYWI